MRIQKLLPLGARSTEALEVSLREWFQSPVGQQVIAAEENVLRAVVSRLFGYYCVHVGPVDLSDVLSECTIKRRFRLLTGSRALANPAQVDVNPVKPSQAAERGTERHRPTALCVGKIDALPFESNSIDAVLLHHCLDTETNPHSVLREACRVMVPGGSIVVAGLNPWSLWGLWRMVTLRTGFARAAAPWGCRFVSPYRLSDWLNLLDFEVEGCETRVGWPQRGTPDPAVSESGFRAWGMASWQQSMFERYSHHFGAVYIMVAKKREACMTPLRVLRQHSVRAFQPVVAAHAREPSTATVSSLVEARRKRDEDPA